MRFDWNMTEAEMSAWFAGAGFRIDERGTGWARVRHEPSDTLWEVLRMTVDGEERVMVAMYGDMGGMDHDIDDMAQAMRDVVTECEGMMADEWAE